MMQSMMPQKLGGMGAIPQGNVQCSLHGKTRGPNNVEETYPGSRIWRCRPGSECKVPTNLQPIDGPSPAGAVICSVHGKLRGPNNVVPKYPGSWRCRPDSECKMPTTSSDNKNEVQGPNQRCGIHNKMRGPNNVEPTYAGSNVYKCKAGSECKMSSTANDTLPGQQAPIHPPEPTTCWAHAKKRSPNQLHQVNTPFGVQWECLPQFKCKGAAGVPAPTNISAGYPVAAMDQGQAYLQQMMLQQNMGLHLGQGIGMGKGHGM